MLTEFVVVLRLVDELLLDEPRLTVALRSEDVPLELFTVALDVLPPRELFTVEELPRLLVDMPTVDELPRDPDVV